MPFSTLGTDSHTGQVVQIARSARLYGVYILGLEGTGKSKLMEHLIMQDIEQGIGLCLLDPNGSIINHVLTHVPLERTTDVILLEARTTVNMHKLMSEGKMLLVKPENPEGVGSAILTQLVHAASSRAQTPVQKRKQFHLYVDEFQRVATEEFALFLTQPARKFGIGTTIAHRARRQLDSKTRNACLAAANLIVFRVSAEDGHALAYQFDTTLPPESQAQAQQQRTKEEMAQKIADELATLPDFVARVRIAKGAKFVDHTIHIPKPTQTTEGIEG
jgi:hypothetical protein